MVERVKLSKRQIKEDKFATFMLQSKGWFMENWQFVVIGAAVVVLVVVAVAYWAGSQSSKSDEARVRFAQAMSTYRSQATQPAILDMTGIIEDFAGTPQAKRATFLLGNLHYQNRNYDEAVRYYELARKEYGKDPVMRAAAQAGKASCLEDQARYAEAGDGFRQAYDDYADGPAADDYLASAARCYLAADSMTKAEGVMTIIKERFAATEAGRRALRQFREHQVG